MEEKEKKKAQIEICELRQEAKQEGVQFLGPKHLPIDYHLHHRRHEISVRVARPLLHRNTRRAPPAIPPAIPPAPPALVVKPGRRQIGFHPGRGGGLVAAGEPPAAVGGRALVPEGFVEGPLGVFSSFHVGTVARASQMFVGGLGAIFDNVGVLLRLRMRRGVGSFLDYWNERGAVCNVGWKDQKWDLKRDREGERGLVNDLSTLKTGVTAKKHIKSGVEQENAYLAQVKLEDLTMLELERSP
ncbi:virulence sensor histidine kinase PhoQ [Striga asiatica]|uniref:Virulence sensor histidine kinase PhoQ n=1 Tax=Striga asiatica TaxID=4170 RepID=A0A5A7PZ74_STRAF|nr:virulence sensor histidine kinase PhoQ [Striga asiatica]